MRLNSILIVLLILMCSGSVLGQQRVEPVKPDSVQAKGASRGGPTLFAAKPGMDSDDDIFYSNAKMYVDLNLNGTDKPSMFIMGTAKFDNAAATIQQGITALTGDFVSLKNDHVDHRANVGAVHDSLFITADLASAGVIRFVGEWNKQTIRREAVALTATKSAPAYTQDKVKYVMNFPKIEVRKESINKYTDIADLGLGYNVETMGMLAVAPNVAMSVGTLDITGGNRFSAEVITDGLDPNSEKNVANNTDPSATAEGHAAAYYKLNSAYLNIKQELKDASGSATDAGYSEVNMKLYNYSQEDAQTDDDVLATNTYKVGGVAGHNATFFRGFTSPFEKLRADYMFYHVLTEPSAISLTSSKGPIGDPKTLINPGRGYFYAMDVSTKHFDQITTDHGIVGGGDSRNRGGYNFSRIVQEVKHKIDKQSLYSFAKGDVARHELQRFNTGGVKVLLVGGGEKGSGLNALGNPYMTPINMKGILGELKPNGDVIVVDNEDLSAGTTPFAVKGLTGAMAVHRLNRLDTDQQTAMAAGVLLRSTYWVVNTALVTNTMHQGRAMYAYNVKYDVVDAGLSTPTVTTPGKRYLEPMQIFFVQAANTGNITFTPELKVESWKNGEIPFDISLTTEGINDFTPVPNPVIRSVRAEGENESVIKDWFVLEAKTVGETITADRTAVRFFSDATTGYDEHDQFKMLNDPNTVASTRTLATRVGTEILEEDKQSNVLYTTTTDGRALLGNAIGYKTKELPLYYIPNSEVEEDVVFTAYGINGFDKVNGVWLVDTHQDNYTLKLEEGTEYAFKSIPSKETAETDNRFILRFYEDDDTDKPSLTENPITCYYSGSTLYIGGLNEKDLDSKVQIFDLQGRMMGSTVVKNYPSMEYQKPLGQGTFVVKITGNRNYTTKFANIQNY